MAFKVKEFFSRLLQELVEGQHMYQILLKQALEENRSHIQLLKQAVEQMSFVANVIRGDRESRCDFLLFFY